MKTISPVITSLFAATCAFVSPPQFAGAQPSGTVTTNVSSSTNLVWDFSAALTNVAVDVTFELGTAVSVSYPVTVSQSGSGVISGRAPDPAAVLRALGLSFPFSGGNYKVTGSVTSNKGQGHAIIKASAMGFVTGSETRRINANQTLNIRFDNTTRTATGTETASVSIHPPLRTGDATGRASLTINESLSTMVAGNGSWTLTLVDLSTTGRTVLGSATVVLDSGATFDFKVRGSFSSSTGVSKLTLTADGKPTRGSSLRVVLNGNDITSIRGAISGQKVNVSL